MNNKPVAFVDEIWITRPDLAKNIGIENMFMRSAIGVKNYVPLYIHPAELTDEEIKFIAYPFESVYTTYDKQTDTDTVHTRFDQLGFAKAILRKASEK